jgi:predicted anti-sigma-YlaC factor YlaD
MNCDSVRNLFSLFLYGELGFEEEEAVHRHLEGCSACRAGLERERAMHAALSQAEVEPAADLLVACRARLHAALPARPVRRTLLSRFWAWT